MPKNMKKASGPGNSHSRPRPPARLSPRKSPLQERSQVTVDAILQGASQVLVKVGYERANTTLIAQAAGVSVGSLYQYYPNKDAVFSALLKAELEQALRLMGAALEATALQPFDQQVRQLVATLCAYKAENPRLHRVLKTELGRIDGAKALRRLNEQTLGLVEAMLRAQGDLPLADPASAAFLAVNAVEGVVCAALLEPGAGVLGEPRFARELGDAVVAMLRSLPLAASLQAAAAL